ncbi:monocarboxylate transporter 2-like [Ixodes scapularis]|uniref:monocarboxylate transporter 2-like n=1 Tax=Ixodes scapularis TaxID=6945 RepID=UPI001A9F918C|nr:monocarboxylate transporter 2-like [Ixodes scapularis]
MGSSVCNRWLVAAACCWMNLFGFAMLRSMAVVYVGVLQEFHVTRGQAAWPLSLTGVFYTFTAPAVGVLARHISVWKLTLAGSVASSICVSLCYFANGIPYLIVCYGISQGISIAFISLTHTVINQNFSNHKAVASGISSAGFTIGGLVFPPMVQFFFNRYGLRGGFLLCGALMLNASAGALLQRGSRAVSISTCDGKAQDDPHKTRSLQEDDLENCSLCVAELSAGLMPKSAEASSKDQINAKDEETNFRLSPRATETLGAHQLGAQNIKLEESQLHAAQNMYEVSRTLHRLVPGSNLQNRIIGSLSFLAILKFYIIVLSFSQIIFSMTTYLTVIVDFAMDRDISRWNAVLLITCCAAVDMVSRLASGWITDKGFLRRSSMMTLHFLLSATSLHLVPLCHSYTPIVFMSVIVGWCNGATIVLIPVFLMELVDAGKFSVCYGTATFLAGLPMLARPVIIGYFRDTLGDYRGLFWLLGTLSACNVILWCWLYWKERQVCNVRNLVNEQRQMNHSQA